jgi:hypothetical protein
MTGALGMSAPLGSSVALAEQDSDNVIDTTEKKRKKKKKSKHSHAVELETEEKGEAEPPVTPAKVAHFYTPILPPPSPFAKKREVEAEIFKAETILPLKITPSAGKEAGKVVPAATSSIVNDNKGLCNFYTQDWENTVGYVRANVKSNMDAESQVEESKFRSLAETPNILIWNSRHRILRKISFRSSPFRNWNQHRRCQFQNFECESRHSE